MSVLYCTKPDCPGHQEGCGTCGVDYGIRGVFGEPGYGVPPKRATQGSNVMTGIEGTLAERGARYGSFDINASIAQRLKETMRATPQWMALLDDQKEALEMVAHKIARILNGDPNYADSWHDIIGYVLLIEKRLEKP